MLEEIHQAAAGAIFRGKTAEDDAAQTGMNDCASAHRARFFGDVQIAVGQAPVTHDALCLREGKHFCVGGGVLEFLNAVVSTRNDAAVAHDDSADGHFFLLPSAPSLAQRFTHEVEVAFEVDVLVHGYGVWACDRSRSRCSF